MSAPSTPRLFQGLTLAVLSIGCVGSLLSAAPALAGTYSVTSTWDLENTRRMLTEALPKEAIDVRIHCQTLNLAVGNDLSRCGADWRTP